MGTANRRPDPGVQAVAIPKRDNKGTAARLCPFRLPAKCWGERGQGEEGDRGILASCGRQRLRARGTPGAWFRGKLAPTRAVCGVVGNFVGDAVRDVRRELEVMVRSAGAVGASARQSGLGRGSNGVLRGDGVQAAVCPKANAVSCAFGLLQSVVLGFVCAVQPGCCFQDEFLAADDKAVGPVANAAVQTQDKTRTLCGCGHRGLDLVGGGRGVFKSCASGEVYSKSRLHVLQCGGSGFGAFVGAQMLED